MKKIRKFVPTKRFVGQSTIPTTIDHYTWTEGRGVYVVFLDGLTMKSYYTLNELTAKEDLTGLGLKEA